MPDFEVVVNDCAAVAVVGGPIPIRSRDTAIGSQNFQFNFNKLVAGLPRQLLPRELDFMETIGHIFAVDLACRRGEGDVVWPRNIAAYLPARDPDYWNSIGARIEHIFADLSGDRLLLKFVKDDSPDAPPRQSRTAFPEHDCVALFSGGVDSFVGTAQLIRSYDGSESRLGA